MCVLGPAGSWSAKGAEDMCQPHVHLTVRDKRGKLLEAVQESPQVTSELQQAKATPRPMRLSRISLDDWVTLCRSLC